MITKVDTNSEKFQQDAQSLIQAKLLATEIKKLVSEILALEKELDGHRLSLMQIDSSKSSAAKACQGAGGNLKEIFDKDKDFHLNFITPWAHRLKDDIRIVKKKIKEKEKLLERQCAKIFAPRCNESI